jgi:RimJ/RimL family protein N-acetyltransferase
MNLKVLEVKDMRYIKSSIDNVFAKYQDYYQAINGGIDGYYENTILDADIYEIIEEEPIACISVHKTRGLTSLVVYTPYIRDYSLIFSYIINLPFIQNILFTEKDMNFLKNVKKHNLDYQTQSYNFEVEKEITTNLQMEPTNKKMHKKIINEFGQFIDYNNMRLSKINSFYLEENNELISFGALEPLRLNKTRYCLSMIVSEKYRGKGYGVETVKFLIQYLQANQLQVNARCYVLNDISKKTLLSGGMKITNELYKIENFKNK